MCQVPGEALYIYLTIKCRVFFILILQIIKLRLREVKLSQPISGRARIQNQFCGTPEAVFWTVVPLCFQDTVCVRLRWGRRAT